MDKNWCTNKQNNCWNQSLRRCSGSWASAPTNDKQQTIDVVLGGDSGSDEKQCALDGSSDN